MKLRRHDWLEQFERGSQTLIRLITFLSLRVGRPVGRFFLYPISAYFLLVLRGSRAASKSYLERVLGRKATLADIYHHYHVFASTVLDRLFLLANRYRNYEFEFYYDGVQRQKSIADLHSASVFIGSHFGSFEVMRVLAADLKGGNISLLMNQENAQKTSNVLDAYANGDRFKIIELGPIDSLIEAKENVQKGGILSVLADRTGEDDRLIELPFLGGRAEFSLGPFLLARVLKLPIILFFGVYIGNKKYRLYFETVPEVKDYARDDRDLIATQWLTLYVSRLEYYCRKYPFNWFNFYDYWLPENS